jgi:hypothetical protein
MVNSDRTDLAAMIGRRHIQLDLQMAEQCFRKNDSSPPSCAVHNVPLIRKQLPDQLIASGYKDFTILVCPVSGTVLNEEGTKS